MPGNGFYGGFLETVGIETESIGLSQQEISGFVIPMLAKEFPKILKQIQITRDASTEFKANAVATPGGALWHSIHTEEAKRYLSERRLDTKTMGYEVITHPLTIPELACLIYPLFCALEKMGDFTSNRAALHFHIGFGNNLRLLKNILRISLMLDPVLFRMGGMGREFRGKVNLSAYARPLMNSVAANLSTRIPVQNSQNMLLDDMEFSNPFINNYTADDYKRYLSENPGKYVQVVNPLSALTASSLEQFWASFSVQYVSGGGSNKYHPSRYCGVNFYGIPQHGTIEFRHFNQTFNPNLVISIAKFLRGVVELSTVLGKNEFTNFDIINPAVEISTADSTDIISMILRMCYDREIENLPTDNEVSLLIETINESSYTPVPGTPVITHLQDTVVPLNLAVFGKLKVFKNVLDSCHIDIHNIKYQSIYDET